MKKIVSLIVCIAFIATAGMTALAQSGSITDPTGDVWHYTWTGGVYDWNYVSNKPNIDITELSYSVSGDQVIFRMKVDGSIENSELISYHGYLNTSDSTYWFMLMNGEGMGMATSTGGDDFKYSECVVTITGDTITATYDVISTLTNVEIWGFAAEYGNLDDLYEDYWQDWAPNDYEPDDVGGDTGGGDTGGGDTGGGDTGGGDTGSGSLTDPANDVYKPGGQTGISNQQHLDIREISYTFDDSGLTLTMELQGTVSDDATYTVTLDTEDASYVMIYDYGGWSSVATSEAGEFIPYFQGAEYGTVSGKTITMLFDRVGSSATAVDFWGQALELGGARDDVPNENGGGTGGGGSSTPPPTGTPGFELIFLIAAIGLLFVVLRKRR